MRAKSCLTALAIVSALLVATSVRDASAEDAGAPALPACIGVNTTSRYVPYGYNHVVILKNGCSKAATCTVSTDVNPTPTSVDVAISTAIEVLTFNASPQQNFVAHVTCKLH